MMYPTAAAYYWSIVVLVFAAIWLFRYRGRFAFLWYLCVPAWALQLLWRRWPDGHRIKKIEAWTIALGLADAEVAACRQR